MYGLMYLQLRIKDQQFNLNVGKMCENLTYLLVDILIKGFPFFNLFFFYIIHLFPDFVVIG